MSWYVGDENAMMSEWNGKMGKFRIWQEVVAYQEHKSLPPLKDTHNKGEVTDGGDSGVLHPDEAIRVEVTQ